MQAGEYYRPLNLGKADEDIRNTHHMFLLAFTGSQQSTTDHMASTFQAIHERLGHVVRVAVIHSSEQPPSASQQADRVIADVQGKAHAKYGVSQRGGYFLFRPDDFLACVAEFEKGENVVQYLATHFK